jgi:hypothetical protein
MTKFYDRREVNKKWNPELNSNFLHFRLQLLLGTKKTARLVYWRLSCEEAATKAAMKSVVTPIYRFRPDTVALRDIRRN